VKIKALDTIERIFVTCSMTAPSADIGVAELAGAHRRQGYSEIAVHAVIRRDGWVEKGRDESVRGAVAPTHASSSFQVCLNGGLTEFLETKGTFTSEQVNALKRLSANYGVPLTFGHEAPLLALKELLKDS
jgi:N-acetylmuramoyl-L-alanine amidase